MWTKSHFLKERVRGIMFVEISLWSRFHKLKKPSLIVGYGFFGTTHWGNDKYSFGYWYLVKVNVLTISIKISQDSLIDIAEVIVVCKALS